MKKLKILVQDTGATLNNPNAQVAKVGQRLLEEDNDEQKGQQKLAKAKEDYQVAQNARRAITTCNHPYDLSTGDKRPPEQFKQELQVAHATLEQISQRIDSTDGQKKKLGKAKASIGSMVQTMVFFSFTCSRSYVA